MPLTLSRCYAIDHAGRGHVGYIQRDIAFPLNGGSNIHTTCLQSLKKTTAMQFGGNDNDRIVAAFRAAVMKRVKAI